MIRVPRVCLVLVVIALLALLVVPVAGARTLSSPPAHNSESGWLSAAFHWMEDLVGLRSHGHRPPSVHRKDIILYPNGGSCINPDGRPNPLCGV